MGNPKKEYTSTGVDETVISEDTLSLVLNNPESAPPSIVLVMGPIDLVGKQWSLDKQELLIGRSPKADIFIDDGSVSGKHAKLVFEKGVAYLVDLESTNGTKVESDKLNANEKHILENNNHIKLGRVLLKYLEKGNIELLTLQQTYDRGQIDSLTEAYNKGAFQRKFVELFKRAKHAQSPLSLIVFDLDNFKAVNDTYGHQAGDYVLREISQLIRSGLIRSNDIFARFGGEEFVIIINGGSLKQAVEAAERIRAAVAGHKFTYNNAMLKVTISVGVATLEQQMKNPEELFERADQATYQSKQAGKNKVSIL